MKPMEKLSKKSAKIWRPLRKHYEQATLEQSLSSIGAGVTKLPREQCVYKEIFGKAKSIEMPGFEPLVAMPCEFMRKAEPADTLQVDVAGMTRADPIQRHQCTPST